MFAFRKLNSNVIVKETKLIWLSVLMVIVSHYRFLTENTFGCHTNLTLDRKVTLNFFQNGTFYHRLGVILRNEITLE